MLFTMACTMHHHCTADITAMEVWYFLEFLATSQNNHMGDFYHNVVKISSNDPKLWDYLDQDLLSKITQIKVCQRCLKTTGVKLLPEFCPLIIFTLPIILLLWLAASQNFKKVCINSQYSHSRLFTGKTNLTINDSLKCFAIYYYCKNNLPGKYF